MESTAELDIIIFISGFLAALIARPLFFYLFPKDNSYYCGWISYDIKRSCRILGITRDIIVNGQWTVEMRSLWRTNAYGDYFFITINEIDNDRKVTGIDKLEAVRFIKKYADKELAEKLLKDWMNAWA